VLVLLPNRLKCSRAQGHTLELELGGIVVVELFGKEIQKGKSRMKTGALASIAAQERATKDKTWQFR